MDRPRAAANHQAGDDHVNLGVADADAHHGEHLHRASRRHNQAQEQTQVNGARALGVSIVIRAGDLR